MQRQIGVVFLHSEQAELTQGQVAEKLRWSLVIAMWWRTLVIRRDLGAKELFFVRNNKPKMSSGFWSFSVFGVRFIWRK